MSFDELSPGSEPPQVDEDVASSAAQEPSGQDAPPLGSSRRRRAKPTGTAAASLPVTSETSPPAPAARTRRKPEPQTNLTTPVDINSTPSDTSKIDPPQDPVRTRRRVRTRAANSELLGLPESPAATDPLVNSPMTEGVSLPSRRRRSAKAASVTATPETVSPPAEEATAPAAPIMRPRRKPRVKPTADASDVPSVSAEPLAPTGPTVGASEPQQARRRQRKRAVRPLTADDAESTPASEIEASGPESVDTTIAPRTRRRRSKRASTRTDADDLAQTKGADSEPIEEAYVAPHVDRAVGAHLIQRNGIPEIHIDGVVHPPVLFFGNIDEEQNRDKVTAEVRGAAGAGIHIHSTIIELPCPVSEISPAFAVAGERLSALLAADVKGYVIPRVVFVPARGWKRDNPSEVSAYPDGSFGDPSIASERYWREAQRSLQLLIAYINQQEWGSRVCGFHLERGEWFQPMSLGYDLCPANRDAFREWLKSKYSNNTVLLRAAWYNADVQFTSAEIPQMLTKANLQRAFYEPRRERSTIDFHEYTSDITAKRLIALATTVKRAAGHRVLVSVCYGYTFEFGHTFSGHLSLGTLLASQAIDLICGPPSYRDRIPGGAASMPAPIDSAPLHGKLWLSEDDTKTFLASAQEDPEDFNTRLESRHATEQAQVRAIGRTIAHTAGIGFMDLWGEGWLDDVEVWQKTAAFISRYSELLRSKTQPRVPEVVAIIDEKSLLHVQRGEQFLRRITAGSRDALQRAGVSYGIYLQSDLTSDTFPLDAKLYLFLTPFRLTGEQRIAVKEKLQRDGKTLAWLYAPGSCEARPAVGGALEETATGAIGIAIRQQEWNSEIGSRIVDTHHVLTNRLLNRDIGVKERLNPSFYVDDPDAAVLAEYHGSGLSSIAVKNCGTWKSVFMGDPILSIDLLRGICRYADVHVWTPIGEDIIDIGNGFVTIHAVKDGHRAIRLPDATGLYDVTDSQHIADEIREHRFFANAGDTRCFCVGTAEKFIAIGLPNVSPAVAESVRTFMPRAGSAPLEKYTRRDRDPSHQLPRNSDLETLEAVLSMDISDLTGDEFEPLPEEPIDFVFVDADSQIEVDVVSGVVDTTGEVGSGTRRRRRRGGRGRGRRRAADGLEATGTPVGTSANSTDNAENGTSIVNTSGSSIATDFRNSNGEKLVWASEHNSETEIPHAEPDASPHRQGDESF